jgi:hypothetical protein
LEYIYQLLYRRREGICTNLVRPRAHLQSHGFIIVGRTDGKPQLTLSANGTIANKTITKVTHSRTKSAIILGSQFLSNQDPRDDSQVPTQRIYFAL